MANTDAFKITSPYHWHTATYQSQTQTRYSRDSLMQWPSNGYFAPIQQDTALITTEILAPAPCGGYIADQVFGSQKTIQAVGLKHTANLLSERCRLHQRHLAEIEQSHLDIQGKKFGAEINNYPDRSKRLSSLESQLLQLDQQRRQEELGFWKDTVDLRANLFEQTSQYKTARDRLTLFADLEHPYGQSLSS